MNKDDAQHTIAAIMEIIATIQKIQFFDKKKLASDIK
jgi:hypothetical protein